MRHVVARFRSSGISRRFGIPPAPLFSPLATRLIRDAA
jgi:hypothetical protein